MNLNQWLERCERLHPTSIEMGLERVERVRERLGLAFACPVVTVAGTNGKGSTCAMLEAIARQAGWRVGVYTSPHLVRFEERCRIDGAAVEAAQLLPHFEAVEAARGDVSLTYFEFTSLVVMRLLSQSPLDLVVLEVGLGGRLDAVNVVDTDCAVITSIDIDHTAFLGADRESIGREKAGIMRAGRPAIVSDPLPPQSLLEHAARIGADLRRFGVDFGYSAQQGDAGGWQQWSWRGRAKRYNGTVIYLHKIHSDLMILRVRPDFPRPIEEIGPHPEFLFQLLEQSTVVGRERSLSVEGHAFRQRI